MRLYPVTVSPDRSWMAGEVAFVWVRESLKERLHGGRTFSEAEEPLEIGETAGGMGGCAFE